MSQRIDSSSAIAEWSGKLGYASGNLGKSIIWSTFETFLLFYLTTMKGFPPWIAGITISAIMVLDGASDVFFGYYSEKINKPRTLHRIVLIGAPIAGLGFWATFSPVHHHEMVISISAIALCRIGYALCDISHNTLIFHLGNTESDKSTISGLRLIFSAAGGSIVGLATSQVLAIEDFRLREQSFSTYAGWAGAMYAATLLVAVLPHEVRISDPHARPEEAPHLLSTLKANRIYVLALLIVAIQAALIPAINRSLPFLGTATGSGPEWAGQALVTIAIAQSASLPLWIWFGRIVRIENVLICSHVLVMFGAASLIQTAATSLESISLIALGTAQAGMNLGVWSLVAISFGGGVKTPTTSGALAMGLFLATLKAAAGFGSLAVAWIVSQSSYAAMTLERPFVMTFVTSLPVLGGVLCITLLLHGRPKRDA